eukprot:TRINITY_DN27509_c0_g1_i1.p1 TRINITY_DN27509_c0_g1~~TRINITY_DN27509_c0_g1_i1.p1  ORF type:complete len:163 (+),score=30.05 TRINITY_DN27509_c0_g1_i1:89-577(+)
MSSTEELLALVRATAACAMALIAIMSLLVLEFSMSMLHSLFQSLVLLICAVVCLHGETRMSHAYGDLFRENFGFAEKMVGRGVAYIFFGLYCIGARSQLVQEEIAQKITASSLFGFTWYLCCMVMLAGGAASFLAWKNQPQCHGSALLPPGTCDMEGYYIST